MAGSLPAPTAVDFSGDDYVGVQDLSILLSHWGASGQWDVDGSGAVDVPDLSVLKAAPFTLGQSPHHY